jgi:hypothetical protein
MAVTVLLLLLLPVKKLPSPPPIGGRAGGGGEVRSRSPAWSTPVSFKLTTEDAADDPLSEATSMRWFGLLVNTRFKTLLDGRRAAFQASRPSGVDGTRMTGPWCDLVSVAAIANAW